MKISELQPDKKNANRGTKRGNKAVADSLTLYGAGRSILLDKAGNIIAGNSTARNAAAAGIDEVIVIPSDGTKIIAVQRIDLDINDPKARELAIADNRTSQLGLDWDPAVLTELSELDLKPFFTGDELTEAMGFTAPNAEKPEPQMDMSFSYSVIVDCTSESEQATLLARLEKEGLTCRLLIS
jgi:hypothetical protein